MEVINYLKIKLWKRELKKFKPQFLRKKFNISNDLERAELLTEIYKHTQSIFNGVPTQLPIPNDIPPEFPRFILNSIDNKFSCQVALSRVDVFYNVSGDSAENDEQLFKTQKTNIQNIFNFLLSKSVIVNRVGFIVVAEKILTPEEGNSLDYLKNNFIQSDKLNSPKELLFNYNRSGQSENFEMNNLIIVSAKAGSNITLQTDINTIAEKMNENNFNLKKFNEIIDYAIEKTSNLISNFPNI